MVCEFSNFRIHSDIQKLDQSSCFGLNFQFVTLNLNSGNFCWMSPIHFVW
jgi:hypothetical protein